MIQAQERKSNRKDCSKVRPQKFALQIADTPEGRRQYSYQRGKYPALDQALESHAATYGTVWSPHLLGPDPISFKQFLGLPEVEALCPIGSDVRFAREELQKLNCFDGSLEQSKTAITAYIRESALFQRHPSYRWVQRIFNSLWRNYDGLARAKQANAAAAIGAANSALRADERKTKDAARKAASRNSDPAIKQSALKKKICKLRAQAAELRADARKKETKALAMLDASKALAAEAALRDEMADQLTQRC
jgi:hypothetical protein